MEYCPKCKSLLPPSEDDSRLCTTCGWFGDATEAATERIETEMETNARTAIELYRISCRNELLIEQAYELGGVDDVLLAKIRAKMANTIEALMTIFRMQRKNEGTLENDDNV